MKKIIILLTCWTICFGSNANECQRLDEIVINASNRAFVSFDNGQYVYGCNEVKIAYRALKSKHYRDCDDVTDAELMLTYQQILEQRCGCRN
jgi:hypothetical protein